VFLNKIPLRDFNAMNQPGGPMDHMQPGGHDVDNENIQMRVVNPRQSFSDGSSSTLSSYQTCNSTVEEEAGAQRPRFEVMEAIA